MVRYVEPLLLTLWVGSLWAIGYLAVPILFATLDDRMLAGMLAGKMFTAVSYIGIGCGTALLVMVVMTGSRGPRDPRVLLPGLMLVLVALGEFVLQPAMAELKLQGLVEGSAAAARFGMLHGIASLLYLANSLCGLLLLLQTARQRESLRAGG
jgi:hypothetical protein